MALRIPIIRNRTRPAGRPLSPAEHRPPEHRSRFEVLLSDLIEARARYEDLRISNAPAVGRIKAKDQLHSLRSAIAALRNGKI